MVLRLWRKRKESFTAAITVPRSQQESISLTPADTLKLNPRDFQFGIHSSIRIYCKSFKGKNLPHLHGRSHYTFTRWLHLILNLSLIWMFFFFPSLPHTTFFSRIISFPLSFLPFHAPLAVWCFHYLMLPCYILHSFNASFKSRFSEWETLAQLDKSPRFNLRLPGTFEHYIFGFLKSLDKSLVRYFSFAGTMNRLQPTITSRDLKGV